jgi:hypothetical protein
MTSFETVYKAFNLRAKKIKMRIWGGKDVLLRYAGTHTSSRKPFLIQ